MGTHAPLDDKPGHCLTEDRDQGHTDRHPWAVTAAVLQGVTPCVTQASEFSRSIRNLDVLRSQKCLLNE